MARSVRSGKPPARTKESDRTARDAARAAARDAGLSLGKYLNQVILEAGDKSATSSSSADKSTSERADELARQALRETAMALRGEAGSPYKSALEMMAQLRDRVTQIESTLEQYGGPPAANDATAAAPWTDRLEDISRQISNAERYMIGGMMTVEEALSRLSERAKALETSVADGNKLALLTQQIAVHVHRHKQEADTRFDDLDAGLVQIKARLQQLESQVRRAEKEPSGEPLMDKLTKALEETAEKDDGAQAAGTSYWGTREDPKSEPLSPAPSPPLKRKAEAKDNSQKKKPSPDAEPSGRPLFDTALLDAVDIEGITYSLPQGHAEENNSADPFAELDTSDLLDTEVAPNVDDDVFLYDRVTDGDDGGKAHAVSGLRNLIKKSHERGVGDHRADADNVASAKDFHAQRLRGLLAIIIAFSFLALLAAGFLVVQSAFHKTPVQDGPLPGAVTPKVGGTPSSKDLSALPPSDPRDTAFAKGDGAGQTTRVATASIGSLSETSPQKSAAEAESAALLARGVNLLVQPDGGATKDEALNLIRQAADMESPSACYYLGVTYERGFYVDQDYQAARQWYEKAAHAGNRKAMHNLAVLHAEGLGTPKDYAAAAKWFKQAAQLGLADSQYNLGILYERGWGVDKDIAQSYKWFSILAKSGDADAKVKAASLGARLDEQSRRDIDAEVEAWQPLPLDPSANDERYL